MMRLKHHMITRSFSVTTGGTAKGEMSLIGIRYMESKNFITISLALMTVGNCGTEICDRFGSVSAQQ
jgi:hypothetical protein